MNEVQAPLEAALQSKAKLMPADPGDRIQNVMLQYLHFLITLSLLGVLVAVKTFKPLSFVFL